jgi:phosphotriesterase-related protein
MEPYLRSAREKGIRSFVDCTPAYIGRDPELLRHLASRTGLQILTNTGYYGGAGDKYVPQHAYQEPAELLANRWLREHQSGIGNTGIKPGFIKTGVDEISGSTLSDIDAKLIRAASLTSQRSGLAVVCHTGGGAAGVAALKLFLQTGGRPDRFIVAHSDSHGVDFNYQVHDLGGWVSFDAVSRRPIEEHVKLISQMWKTNRRRLLLSQDNGWYSVGQPNGGEVRGYTDLGEKLLPQLRVNGFDAEELEELMVTNPARAFSLRPS